MMAPVTIEGMVWLNTESHAGGSHHHEEFPSQETKASAWAFITAKASPSLLK